MNNKKLTLNLILVFIMILVLSLSLKTCYNDYLKYDNKIKKEKEKLILLENLKDSLIQYKNKNNQLVSKISVFQAEKVEYVLDLETKNEEIIKLKELLKSNKSAKVVTQIETKTIIDTIFKEIEVYNILENGIKLEEWTNGWFNGYVKFKPTFDSNGEPTGRSNFDLRIETINKLNIVHKKDDKGKMFVEITDENPYSQVKSIRSYYKTQKTNINNNRFGIGANISYGINYKGEFYPYIGLGLNYNLIRF